MKSPYTLDNDQKVAVRNTIFRHLDGLAVIPSAVALKKKGVLQEFARKKSLHLSEIVRSTYGNPGYLNVALHLLASQGWLAYLSNGDDPEYQLTAKGLEAFSAISVYDRAYEFFPFMAKMNELVNHGFSGESIEILEDLIRQMASGWKIEHYEVGEEVSHQMSMHLEGILIGPIIVALGMGGHLKSMRAQKAFNLELKNPVVDDLIFALFISMKWVDKDRSLTPLGDYHLGRAAAYGVTVSYLQTFCWAEDLLYFKGDKLWDKPKGAKEIHVDRTMNVWGSGGAHSTYFKVVDEIIREMFNKPIDEQPKGVADMGCGNGAFLEHLYSVVKNETARGQMLDTHPLLLVGSDFNQAAIEATRLTLVEADIEHHVLFGDIGNPQQLADDLMANYGVALGDMLNVRSFLDHNRIFETPVYDFSSREGVSTGAFAFRGRRISNAEIEQNLAEHLYKWFPYVQRFGLLNIELHTVCPEKAAAHNGEIAMTAYDGTHGFTDQYIVEHEVFLQVAQEVGLKAQPALMTAYPSNELPVVSINLFKSA